MSNTLIKTFPISTGEPVFLRGTTNWLTVDVIAMPEISEVNCEARAYFLDEAALADTVRFWAEGNTVFFEALPTFVKAIGPGRQPRLTVTVPEGCNLALVATSGTLRVEGGVGEAQVRTQSGSIRIESAQSVVADATSGSIRLGRVGGARAHANSGSISAQSVHGPFDLQASSGSISVEDLIGEGRVAAKSGSIRIGDLTGDLTATANSGSIRIGRFFQGHLTLETTSGSQKIGIAAGTAVLVDASVRGGVVRSDLGGADPAQHQRTGEIFARAGHGTIRIHRA